MALFRQLAMNMAVVDLASVRHAAVKDICKEFWPYFSAKNYQKILVKMPCITPSSYWESLQSLYSIVEDVEHHS